MKRRLPASGRWPRPENTAPDSSRRVSSSPIWRKAQLLCGESGAVCSADEAVDVARRQGAQVAECFALLTRAEIRRSIGGDANDISADLQAAHVLMEEIGALTYKPFILEEFGRLRGDEAELLEALQLYRRLGAARHARRLEGELSARTAP